MIRQKLLRWHFYALLFVVINSVFRIFDVRIVTWIILPVAIFLFLSAVVLFFWSLRPFKKISLYFSLYIITPALIFFSFLADGIMGVVMASVFSVMLAIGPLKTQFKSESYKVYDDYLSFLDECCKHVVYQQKLLLFEKRIATVSVWPADSLSFHTENDQLKFIQYDKKEEGLYKADSVVFDLVTETNLTNPQSP